MSRGCSAALVLVALGGGLASCKSNGSSCQATLTLSTPGIGPGQSAQLTALFSGGSGTVTPDVGPVKSGVAVAVQPAATTTYSLAVSGCPGSQTTTLTVLTGLPAAPALVNLAAAMHGDTAHLSFEPVSGALDYRVFVAPQTTDLAAQADGGVGIRNATYRCSGDREAPTVPTDGEPQVGGGAVLTYVAHRVAGFARSAADAILGHVYLAPAAGLSPVWAMGDPSSDGDNPCFFQRWTESRAKRYVSTAADHAALLAAGWRDDGIAFYVPAAGAGTILISTALTTDQPSARLYFAPGAEEDARASLAPTPAFSVLASAADGTAPLYRVFYQNGCGRSHDELVAGGARFARAVHQGLTPIPALHWAGLTAPTTLVVEALDQGCPFQGLVSPRPVDGGCVDSPPVCHQEFASLDRLRAGDPLGEVFVGGQHDAANRPRALARSFVQVSPAPLEPMDFSDDFAPDGGTILPMTPTGHPPFQSLRFDTPAYDVTAYSIDTPYFALGPLLGELWVTYGDWAADTNGKLRLTPKRKATLSAGSFLHVMEEVDIVSSNRRYPQILISDRDAPVQESLPAGSTLVLQTFGDWPTRIDLEMCDHRTWDVNNQCPRFYIDKLASDPFGKDPLPPHAEVGDKSGVDRRVRLDLYVSTARAYIFLDNEPWACANLPASGGMPAGPVTVTFGDVLYHSGVDVPNPPYVFHSAHMRTETSRHFDALGFKSGVPAPAWDETRLPCASSFK